MDTSHIVFTLDEQMFALPLSVVERVVRVVEVTPLPKAPEIVLGMVNFQGRVIPVVDIRKRFRLPEREMNLSDQLIIARTQRRAVALVVDATSGVFEGLERGAVAAEKILHRLEYIEGVAKLEDNLILIHDLDKFLSLEEERALSDVIMTLS